MACLPPSRRTQKRSRSFLSHRHKQSGQHNLQRKHLFLRSIHTHCLEAYFHPLGHSPCNANCARSVRLSLADLLRKSKDRRTQLAIHPPPASIAVNASPFPAHTAPNLLNCCSMISWTLVVTQILVSLEWCVHTLGTRAGGFTGVIMACILTTKRTWRYARCSRLAGSGLQC